MLEGGYYRSLANEQTAMQKASIGESERMDTKYDESASEDENAEQDATKEQNVTSSDKAVNYKSQFRFLKRKLKFLIYENEFFQDALRSNQRRLLKVSRDRAFLLDRLLQYEKPENTSSESEETESSEDEVTAKRRKLQEAMNTTNENSNMRGRKKKTKVSNNSSEQMNTTTVQLTGNLQTDNLTHTALGLDAEIELEQEQQCHISAAEVERHLQAKQPIIDLLSERAPATVPTEMFSMEQSLDSLHPL